MSEKTKKNLGVAVKEKFGKIKKFFKENTISALTAVFLGIATLLVAWAGWIGALHDGNQASNYTRSNNLAAEGNAEYNVGAQVYISDLFTWNTILGLQVDLDAARGRGDGVEAAAIETKIEKIKQGNCSPRLVEYINKHGMSVSPFDSTEYVDGYFTEAKKLLDESQAAKADGEQDNLWSDSYQLASVLYSLVLFLLGIIGVLNDYQSRKMLLVFSVIILALAVLYMLTIPMPRGFDLAEFFNLK
ncbi:hypothetical protein IKE72_01930 [Candidatus Saccharibacteria bacterium]|nr:hypothetical protein [Candidatus Saccharibacteria bacterium]